MLEQAGFSENHSKKKPVDFDPHAFYNGPINSISSHWKMAFAFPNRTSLSQSSRVLLQLTDRDNHTR